MASSSNVEPKSSSTPTTQWISAIVNIESKSPVNPAHLNSIVGPLKKHPQIIDETFDDHDRIVGDGSYTHSVVCKITEPVFIDCVSVYEKVSSGSSVLKIEAKRAAGDNRGPIDEWFTCWDKSADVAHIQSQVFSSPIRPTPFKSDTIKLTLNGSLHLINAIGKMVFSKQIIWTIFLYIS